MYQLLGMRSIDRQKVNVFEMKCVKNMASMNRSDKIRNEAIRERMVLRTQ